MSSSIARRAEESFGLDEGSVGVILNGVDSDAFRPRPRTRSPLRIGFIGRTGREKGADLLLRAGIALARSGHRFELEVIGSNTWGPVVPDAYQGELTQLVGELQSLGVTVTQCGHIERAHVPAKLAQLDIQVVPSRWAEPCALTLLEGMATGLPIVASDTGGTPEVLQGAGLLFPMGDVEALTRQLAEVIRLPALRHDLSERARARAEYLTWSRTWSALARELEG